MKCTHLTIVFLLSFFSAITYAHNVSESGSKTTNAVYTANPDISLRYHAQWNVPEGTQKKLHKAYGMRRISFDPKGHPIPKGLSAMQKKRWKQFYELCMGDGCYFCDEPKGIGSCELNTCGENNEHCKPHVGRDGQPVCGKACADYAFMHLSQF